MALTAMTLNCTLKPSVSPSSTDKLLQEVLAELKQHDVLDDIVRVASLDIKPGVTSDEGEGDECTGSPEPGTVLS